MPGGPNPNWFTPLQTLCIFHTQVFCGRELLPVEVWLAAFAVHTSPRCLQPASIHDPPNHVHGHTQ